MDIPKDDMLIEQYKKGDSDSFEVLFERYRKPVFNYVLGMLHDRAAAEDVFQETFYRILRNVNRYRPGGTFSGFVYTIANNMAIDYLRKKKRMKESSLYDEGDEMRGAVELQAGQGESPERIFENSETGRMVRAAIRSLPLEQRQVLLLREYCDIPFREISRIVGCPLNTALGRMHYALKNLRKWIEQHKKGSSRDGCSSFLPGDGIGGMMFYGV